MFIPLYISVDNVAKIIKSRTNISFDINPIEQKIFNLMLVQSIAFAKISLIFICF